MFHLAAVRRTTAALVLAGYLPAVTGCTSWKTQQGSFETVVAAQPRVTPQDPTAPASPMQEATSNADFQSTGGPSVESIRISTATSTNLELVAPRIANDTLYGRPRSNAPEIGIPLADITSVKARQFSTGKTVALSVGLAAGALLIIGTVAAANSPDDCCFTISGSGSGGKMSCPLIYSWDGRDGRPDQCLSTRWQRRRCPAAIDRPVLPDPRDRPARGPDVCRASRHSGADALFHRANHRVVSGARRRDGRSRYDAARGTAPATWRRAYRDPLLQPGPGGPEVSYVQA